MQRITRQVTLPIHGKLRAALLSMDDDGVVAVATAQPVPFTYSRAKNAKHGHIEVSFFNRDGRWELRSHTTEAGTWFRGEADAKGRPANFLGLLLPAIEAVVFRLPRDIVEEAQRRQAASQPALAA